MLEIAISEDYRVKRSDEGEMEKSSKLSILKGLSWMGMVNFFLLSFRGRNRADPERLEGVGNVDEFVGSFDWVVLVSFEDSYSRMVRILV